MSYIYMEHLFLMFLDHTKRRTTVGRTPLDEWSARRTEVFLTLNEVFPCFFLSCKANARVKLAKTGHGPHSSTLVCICVVRLLFVLFYVLFLCKCVLPPGDNPIAVNKYHIISYVLDVVHFVGIINEYIYNHKFTHIPLRLLLSPVNI